MKEKIESAQCESSFDAAEELFEGRCAINARRILVLISAMRKLGNIVKINEIIKDELAAFDKLDLQEQQL